MFLLIFVLFPGIVVKINFTESASTHQISLFLAEGTMMFGMMHKNILPIIGVNVEIPRKPMLVYPYVNKGNLKR